MCVLYTRVLCVCVFAVVVLSVTSTAAITITQLPTRVSYRIPLYTIPPMYKITRDSFKVIQVMWIFEVRGLSYFLRFYCIIFKFLRFLWVFGSGTWLSFYLFVLPTPPPPPAHGRGRPGRQCSRPSYTAVYWGTGRGFSVTFFLSCAADPRPRS